MVKRIVTALTSWGSIPRDSRPFLIYVSSAGRWDSMGEEMFRLKDRHGSALCLSPVSVMLTKDFVVTVQQAYAHILYRYQVSNQNIAL